jgi:hypothetical protein
MAKGLSKGSLKYSGREKPIVLLAIIRSALSIETYF